MARFVVALAASALATLALAQPAATMQDKQKEVQSVTADKGYTQRAGEQAAKAKNSTDAKAKEEARKKRMAESRANVEATTADKGYTQRAGEQAAKAKGSGMSPEARAKRQAASKANVEATTADKGYTQRAGDAAAKAAADAKK